MIDQSTHGGLQVGRSVGRMGIAQATIAGIEPGSRQRGGGEGALGGAVQGDCHRGAGAGDDNVRERNGRRVIAGRLRGRRAGDGWGGCRIAVGGTGRTGKVPETGTRPAQPRNCEVIVHSTAGNGQGAAIVPDTTIGITAITRCTGARSIPIAAATATTTSREIAGNGAFGDAQSTDVINGANRVATVGANTVVAGTASAATNGDAIQCRGRTITPSRGHKTTTRSRPSPCDSPPGSPVKGIVQSASAPASATGS